MLGGRETRHRTDAQTRPLVVCFFTKALGVAGELLVERIDKSFAGMTTRVVTPTELALCLGFVKPAAGERTTLEMGVPRRAGVAGHSSCGVLASGSPWGG